MSRSPRRLVAAALLATVPVLIAVGCSSSDDESDSTTTTTAEATTSTTAAPVTTTTTTTAGAGGSTTTAGTSATTATTTTGGGSVVPTDPGDYATAFVEAWEVGDHNTALGLGTQDAVDSIFAFDSGGPDAGWTLVGCEGAAGSSFCTFNAGGDPTVVVQVGNQAASLGQLHAVTQVQVSG